MAFFVRPMVYTVGGNDSDWGLDMQQGREEREGCTGTGGDLDYLLDVLVSLGDRRAVYDFLQDLCTPRELEDLSQRLQVARMLDVGLSYTKIQSATGASATTVARVARCLKYGSGGYRLALDGLPVYRDPGEPAGGPLR